MMAQDPSQKNQQFQTLMKVVLGLFGVRFLVLLIASPLPFDFPHIWRQVDTVGVAMRYFSRFALETGVESGNSWLPLPAVLNSGDELGIMRMEFPLLNLMTAPFFAAGPALGKTFATIFVAALYFGLSLLCVKVWKGKKVAGIDAGPAMLLLPIFSISGIYSGKFMPDYLSMVLMILGVGLSWHDERPVKSLGSFLLCALGMLVKPPAIIVFALFLTAEKPIRRILKASVWAAPAIVVALAYYTAGLKMLAQLEGPTSLFAVQFRDPLMSLLSVLERPREMAAFLFNKPFFPGGMVLVVAFCVLTYWKTKRWPFAALWWVALIQMLAVALLDGEHAFIHNYYYIGCSVTFCLIAWGFLQEAKHRLWHWAAFAIAAGGLFDLSYFDLRGFLPNKIALTSPPFAECSLLRERNPDFPWKQGVVFRSPQEVYPSLGVCFGERQNSKTSSVAFFWADEGMPFGCREIDRTARIQLARCD